MRASFLMALALVLPLQAAAEAGRTQYMLHCSGCHGGDGDGYLQRGIPPFSGIIGKFANHPDGRVYLVNVGGSRSAAISNAQRTVILNWILHAWGSEDLPPDFTDFTEAEVSALFTGWRGDSAKLRESIGADLLERGMDIGPLRSE